VKQKISTDAAPAPAGHYSHAVRMNGLVWVAGQVPRQPDGSYTGLSVAEETQLTLRNLSAVLAAAGAGLDDVVKVTAYLSDSNYFAEFNAAYADFFLGVSPARTTIVAGLRQVKVEIDAVACVAD
jgi:2-iminobutanoate/2-iminopropanoate deaminase